MQLAGTDLFRARWTADIHDEWMRNVLAARPDLTHAQLERTRQLMDDTILDCLVENYQDLIPALNIPDPDDRHVLAAAIRAGAQVIVTYNRRDFPDTVLQQYGIEAQHPDVFIHHLLTLDAAKVVEACRKQRARLRNPPKTAEIYLDTLRKQGLAQTVGKLDPWQHLL